MDPKGLHGAIAPVYTVFDETGAFDESGQRAFLDYLAETGGLTAYFVRSGLGQMYAFSYEEVRAITRIACGHFAGKAPVFVGTTGIWDRNLDRRPDPDVFLEQAVSLSRYAQDCGAAAVVHTMPEAITPVAHEGFDDVILRYFEAVTQAVSIPVIAYQPPITEEPCRATPRLLARLADMPGLAAIKASTLNAEYLFNLAWAVRDKNFAIIAGCETVYYVALCLGINATIGQGCTTNPRVIRAIEDRFRAGDRAGAIAAQASVNRLVAGIRNVTEFTKRYAREQGRAIPVYTRRFVNNPYWTHPEPLSEAEYQAAKALFLAETAPYA